MKSTFLCGVGVGISIANARMPTYAGADAERESGG